MSRPSAIAVLRALGDGHTTAEIAVALQCSPSQASRRLMDLRARGDVEQVMAAPARLEWRRTHEARP